MRSSRSDRMRRRRIGWSPWPAAATRPAFRSACTGKSRWCPACGPRVMSVGSLARTRLRTGANRVFSLALFQCIVRHRPQCGRCVLRVARRAYAAGRIARAVDTRSVNSGHSTQTLTSSAEAARYVSRSADVRLIVHAVMGAVLCTLLLLSANTMAQGFRERIRELAVLKTLGFDNVRVSVRLLAESAIVCRVGGSSACWPRGRGERLCCSIGGTTSASPMRSPERRCGSQDSDGCCWSRWPWDCRLPGARNACRWWGRSPGFPRWVPFSQGPKRAMMTTPTYETRKALI